MNSVHVSDAPQAHVSQPSPPMPLGITWGSTSNIWRKMGISRNGGTANWMVFVREIPSLKLDDDWGYLYCLSLKPIHGSECEKCFFFTGGCGVLPNFGVSQYSRVLNKNHRGVP